MNRLLMGLAACALIMTSCSKNDVIENVTNGQNQLSFSTGIGKQAITRATELDNSALQTAASTNGIVLHAYQDATGWSKWYNDIVKYSGDKWTLQNSVRFRNANATKYITYLSTVTDALTNPTNFDNATFVPATGIFPKFTYTVATNSATQEDLIAGITEVDANKTDITLGMRHILSQINFGTVGYQGAQIQIQNIQIEGVGNSADFTYRGVNTYPIGDWSTPITKETTYQYYNWNSSATNDTQPAVPAAANKGDVYIFGDGGNWGPGKSIHIFYPVGTDNAWANIATPPQIGLKNSLMLLPQTLTDAKVTFEYKIQDVSGAYVVGNASIWEKGEFSLDFKTGTEQGKLYLGKWEQNYRYVYLIDFTDFLDGVALTFKVDVNMYEWENYNKGTTDDGIVDVMTVGQPTEANMNATTFVDGDIWYIASQSETAPNATDPSKWAQVMVNESWNLSAYDFKNIATTKTFTLNFENVIFNTIGTASNATITMTLPDGFSATIPNSTTNITVTAHATLPNTWVISKGDKSALAAITITNDRYYRTSAELKTGVEAVITDALKFGYSGTNEVNLTTIQPTNVTNVSTLTVKFNCTILPTVGATTDGLWTWDAATKTATWIKVTWNDLATTKTAVTNAATNAVIYCSDSSNINLAIELEEPTVNTNSPISVVFSLAATRTGNTTAGGTWTYNPATKTATWTKN